MHTAAVWLIKARENWAERRASLIFDPTPEVGLISVERPKFEYYGRQQLNFLSTNAYHLVGLLVAEDNQHNSAATVLHIRQSSITLPPVAWQN